MSRFISARNQYRLAGLLGVVMDLHQRSNRMPAHKPLNLQAIGRELRVPKAHPVPNMSLVVDEISVRDVCKVNGTSMPA